MRTKSTLILAGISLLAFFVVSDAEIGHNAGSSASIAKTSGVLKGDGSGGAVAATANTDYAAATHASRHQHGGADEVATTTAGANAIPKADSNGQISVGFLPYTSTSATVTSIKNSSCTSANLGALKFATNNALRARCSGSVWLWSFRAGTEFVMLADSGFSWVNQGDATVSTTTGGIRITAPATSGDNRRAYVTSLPSTPWTCTLRFTPELFVANFNGIGLILRESATGKLASQGIFNNTGLFAGPIRFGSATASGSVLASIGVAAQYQGDVFVQINGDGTNIKYRISNDGGITYFEQLSELKTASFTTAPDQYGIYAESNSSTYPAAMTAWELGCQ